MVGFYADGPAVPLGMEDDRWEEPLLHRHEEMGIRNESDSCHTRMRPGSRAQGRRQLENGLGIADLNSDRPWYHAAL